MRLYDGAKRTGTYYKMMNQVDHSLNGVAYEQWESIILKLLTIRRLAKKHHRLAEMSCNGEGWIRGQRYYGGAIDEWAKRQYGATVKSSYVAEDVTVFDQESDKVEAKIRALVTQLGPGWVVEFQGDPRGHTVKLTFQDSWIDINF